MQQHLQDVLPASHTHVKLLQNIRLLSVMITPAEKVVAALNAKMDILLGEQGVLERELKEVAEQMNDVFSSNVHLLISYMS